MINSITGAGETRARRARRKNSPIPGTGCIEDCTEATTIRGLLRPVSFVRRGRLHLHFHLLGAWHVLTDLDDQLHCIALHIFL